MARSILPSFLLFHSVSSLWHRRRGLHEVAHVDFPALGGPLHRHGSQSTCPEPVKGYDGRTGSVRHLKIILSLAISRTIKEQRGGYEWGK